MFVALLLILLLSIFYVRFRKLRTCLYEFAKTLPTVGEMPILGHTHWFLGGSEKILKNIQTLAGAFEKSGTVNKLWLGPTLYILTTDPEDVQKILDNCLEKDWSYKFLRAWLGNGLFVAPVDLWKSHRKLLLPVFHNRIVEDYIEVFAEQGDVLVKRLMEQVGKRFDVYDYVTSCMLDIVFETAMGEKMDVQHSPDTLYLRARKAVMSIINLRLFKAWLQPDSLFNLTSHAKLQRDCIDVTHRFTDEVINKKKKTFENCNITVEGRKDILQLLLERNLNFSNVELREHIDSITIAGNDTTALVISYALLLFGCHQDVQEKVHVELTSIFGNSLRSSTKEDLSKMELLERVIKETMRLYTVVPVIGRKTVKELKLSTCTVPPGVGCAVIPLVMHRSKKLWGPDADCFNPDRFLPENSTHRHPCAYIPFSYGVRNCIEPGLKLRTIKLWKYENSRHFGMLAMKSILANILRNYKVSSAKCDRLKVEILLFPVLGHLITLEKRNAARP